MRIHLIAAAVVLALVSASAGALEAVTAFFGTAQPSLAARLTRAWLELPLPDCGGGGIRRSETQ